MKYIKQPNGYFMEVEEGSELFKSLKSLPKEKRPEFLNKNDKEVVAYFEELEKPAKTFKDRSTLKKSALAKIAKVAEKAGFSLTDEELAALQ